ncbi:regucalcin-like [Aricia agestis]|uniref:regucalcin-like n=1 Tax=Aricia agestis TaxID=91739 RepID=UPI001C201C5E|nr:regucalcin-like [Aricia agestis]
MSHCYFELVPKQTERKSITVPNIMKVLLVIFFLWVHENNSIQAQSSRKFSIKMLSSAGDPNSTVFRHAESPVWDEETQSLLFVDVHSQNVHRFDYMSGKIYTKHIGYGQVNVVALIRNSSRHLVAVRSALYLLDWGERGDASLRLLATVDEGKPDNVINEGAVDARGRFWAGTKGPHIGLDVMPDQAILFKIGEDTSYRPVTELKPVSISNGLTWSLNNSLLYYIDSPTKKIEAFDYDLQDGSISGRRTIIDISDHGYTGAAIPDGMTIDADGYFTVFSVLHIDPERRKIVYAYKIPASRVTSLCWGGEALDELFVTTSRTDEPDSGRIYNIRGTGRRGIPAKRFKFNKADDY